MSRFPAPFLACVAAVLPAALPAAETDPQVRSIEQSLTARRRSLSYLERRAVAAPAALAELYDRCLAFARKEVEAFEVALEAARAGDAQGRRDALELAGAYSRAGGVCNSLLNGAGVLLAASAGGTAEATDGERAVRKRAARLLDEVRGLCLSLDPAAPPQRDELRRLDADIGRILRQADALRNLLGLYEKMRRLEERRDREKEPALRQLYAERLQIQERLIALAGEELDALARGDDDALRAIRKEKEDLQRRARDWEAHLYSLRDRLRRQKELANAPPELRPLVEEKVALEEEAERLRAALNKAEDYGPRQVILQARCDALEARIEALDEIISAREELLLELQDADDVRGYRMVRAAVARVEKALDRYEKMLRDAADLYARAAELYGRAEAAALQAEDFRDEMDRLWEVLADAITTAQDLADEAGAEEAGEAAALRQRLTEDLQDFDERFGELGRAAPQLVQAVRALFLEALRKTDDAEQLLGQGRDIEAGESLAAALASAQLADTLAASALGPCAGCLSRLSRLAAAGGDGTLRQAWQDLREKAAAEISARLTLERLIRQNAAAEETAAAEKAWREAAVARAEACRRLDQLMKEANPNPF